MICFNIQKSQAGKESSDEGYYSDIPEGTGRNADGGEVGRGEYCQEVVDEAQEGGTLGFGCGATSAYYSKCPHMRPPPPFTSAPLFC
jgi:hypothetical protein